MFGTDGAEALGLLVAALAVSLGEGGDTLPLALLGAGTVLGLFVLVPRAMARIRRQPEVLDVYFVAGANDYLLHVAVASTTALRDFVAEHLSRDADVALTETNLIFEHTRAAGRS